MNTSRNLEMESLIRNYSMPGKVVPLLLNKAGNKLDNGECCALTLRKAMSASAWKNLVDEAFEIYDFVNTHSLKCSEYSDKHADCIFNCACLVDVPKDGESKIRLLSVDETNLKIPYKICFINGALNFQLLKLPTTSPLGCLSFGL